jgi:ribose transport system permease protein
MTELQADKSPGHAPARRPAPERAQLASAVSSSGVAIFLVVIVVVFCFTLPSTFPTSRNVFSLLGDQSVPGLLALAAIVPLAAGAFDLSVAAILGFCSLLAAEMASHAIAWPLVLITAVAVGAAIGAVNSFLIVKVRINPFIATLGMSTVLAGGNLWITGGNTIYQNIATSFTDVTNTDVGGLPIIVFYFVFFILLLWYVLERTPFGRYLRATGLGSEAARLSGVRTQRYLSSAFVIAGAIAGLAGMLETARLGSASPSVGPAFLLPAYAAAFLGATTIRRGRFNVWGTVIGVLLLAVCTNGLTLAGAPFWVPDVFDGAALIVAVGTSALVSRRSET